MGNVTPNLTTNVETEETVVHSRQHKRTINLPLGKSTGTSIVEVILTLHTEEQLWTGGWRVPAALG